MVATYELTITKDESFSQSEVEKIVNEYVCAVCHDELTVLLPPNQARALIVCPIHGNIVDCGRVTRNTVSIETEKSYKTFHAAITALPDLWGDLIDLGMDRTHALKIAHENVCAVCGQPLLPYFKTPEHLAYDVGCSRHGSVSVCGYIAKNKYVYNFQAIRVWEKEHPRKRG